VGAEGQLGDAAAELAVEAADDQIPEVGAPQVAVEEPDLGAAAGLVVVQGAGGEIDGGHGIHLHL